MLFPLRTPRGATAGTEAVAEPAGGWAPADPMPGTGFWAQPADVAVLLDTGSVLLAGGEDGRRNALNTASLFNPVDKTWAPTGALQTSRRLHTMTKLAGGSVLVTGGVTGPLGSPVRGLASAELYEPGAKTWSPVPDMHEARFSHSATLLPNGHVLVAGGCAERSSDTRRALASAEIYNPIERSWTKVKPAMTDGRFGHPAILLKGTSKVLVVGGIVPAGPGQYAALGYCEIYDFDKDAWTPTGSLATPRKGHQATLLDNGSVLVTGGDIVGVLGQDWTISPFSQNSTERYDPVGGRWSPDTPMTWGRSHHRAVRLGSGKVLVLGGTDDGTFDIGYRNAAVYDPRPKTWADAGPMAVGRWAPAVLGLGGESVLVAGGIVRSGAAAPTIGEDLLTDTAEVYTS
ncbi:kelch repeat-containing protein [Kribbella sp. NPDC006257]|uniref:Kelch repeat-containing protein n=1 Tax=Kribbella sp. NPDC006257 TaxID=3156738 RepID=UPI0033AD2A06